MLKRFSQIYPLRVYSSSRSFLISIQTPHQLASSTVQRYSTPSSPKAECYIDRLEGSDKGIAVLTMNRPAAKNALGRTFVQQFRDALVQLRFDREVRIVILQSLVDKVFCAGADLKERATMSPTEVDAFVHGLRTGFSELESLPMPTIAAIDGAALGGGLEMALAADLRIAGSDAKLGLVETKLAIIPGAGGTQRLPRIIGIPKAKELIYTAKVLNAVEAEHIGLINHAINGSSYPKALEIAREILSKGPVAVRMAKLAIDKGMQVDIATGLAFEQAYYAQIIPTQDRLEGLKAFKEKRTPIYTGQ